ncbi:MAG: MBL fold metallo-hydrolase [Flavobacteriales bacterium]|nr:MBL fold metallo-hydrolase [Flavobacteriales bacterium]
MRRLPKTFHLLTLFALCLVHPSVMAQPTKATFLGNCAFRIDLTDWTIYSDFPYESGYSGYSSYALPEGFNTAKGTALITHAHRDHFDHALFSASKLELIAADQPEADRAAVLAKLEARGIYVYPLPTPHADLPHNSYLVAANGRRLYFTGDTEDPKPLLDTQGIDVAFVTPWLITAINKSGRTIGARTVIMYHHTKDEFAGVDVKAPCTNCRFIIPEQGEVIELFR